MKLTIYKYLVPTAGASQEILMPKGAQLIHVNEQGGDILIWAIVEPDAPKVWREIDVVGTGWELHRIGKHIGTAHCGTFVWHVFDTGDERAA
jgi:hypothetical protein